MGVAVVEVTLRAIGNGKTSPRFCIMQLLTNFSGIVLYELMELWGASKRTTFSMAGGFFVIQAVTVVFLAMSVVQLKGEALRL